MQNYMSVAIESGAKSELHEKKKCQFPCGAIFPSNDDGLSESGDYVYITIFNGNLRPCVVSMLIFLLHMTRRGNRLSPITEDKMTR